jgi:hypothetical protein
MIPLLFPDNSTMHVAAEPITIQNMLQNPDDYVLVCQIPYIFIHIYSHRINDGVTGKILIEVSFYVKYGRQTSFDSPF